MFSTSYKCSRCGGTVSKSDHVCPHCHARLAGIKCTRCGFMGIEKDFTNDRCPKCGSVVRTSATQPQPVKLCPDCKKKWDGLFCEKCGKTNWTVTILYLVGAVFSTIVALVSLADLVSHSGISDASDCGLLGFGVLAIFCWYKSLNVFIRRSKANK